MERCRRNGYNHRLLNAIFLVYDYIQSQFNNIHIHNTPLNLLNSHNIFLPRCRFQIYCHVLFKHSASHSSRVLRGEEYVFVVVQTVFVCLTVIFVSLHTAIDTTNITATEVGWRWAATCCYWNCPEFFFWFSCWSQRTHCPSVDALGATINVHAEREKSCSNPMKKLQLTRYAWVCGWSAF